MAAFFQEQPMTYVYTFIQYVFITMYLGVKYFKIGSLI